MRSYGWIGSAGLLAAGMLAGCGNGLPKNEAVQQRVALTAFDDCASLEQYLEDRAVLDMRAQMTAAAENEGGYDFNIGFPGGAAMADEASKAAPPTSQASGPTSYTQTNTQVAGVDEADFVKNDGTHILVLSGGTLYVNKSWPADQLATVSQVAIEGWPREMFLDEQNRVVVFSQVYNPYDWYGDSYYCKGWAGGGRGDVMACAHDYANTLKMTVLDLSDDANPTVVREEYVAGTYLSSRRIGAAVRVVTSDPFRWPAGVFFYPRTNTDGVYHDKAMRVKAYQAQMDENETVIRAQSLDQWLPAGERRLPDGSKVAVPYRCSEFSKATGPTILGLVTVATLNLDDATAPVSRTSVLSQADEVYASAGSLYLASKHWWWWPEMGQEHFTYVHKFDITQPDKAVHVASGTVEGHILDQFSMDEHDGYLRMALNRGKRVSDPSGLFGRFEISSRVAVLGEKAGALEVVGWTDDLAKGEQLKTSRFMGDRGFLVTFLQVDPLFTLDLSDPTHPKQIGELKVPGFSTYLHPIDENHLLAIGEESWKVKLSLFDVTVLAAPKELSTLIVGAYSGDSEALYEHKAFNYFAEKKLLAIPFFDWAPYSSGNSYWTNFVSDLRVFKIDLAAGITPVGALSMSDLYARGGSGYYSWDWRWQPGVRRSVMADDFVYAVSDAGIRSANVNALASPLKTIQFAAPTDTGY